MSTITTAHHLEALRHVAREVKAANADPDERNQLVTPPEDVVLALIDVAEAAGHLVHEGYPESDSFAHRMSDVQQALRRLGEAFDE